MNTERDIGAFIAQDRRTFIKRVLGGTIAGSLLLVMPAAAAQSAMCKENSRERFAFVVDITACIGCGSCCRADMIAYEVPAGRFRTWVERYVLDHEGNAAIDLVDLRQGGRDDAGPRAAVCRPAQETFFVPKLCRMCKQPACREVCPAAATYRTDDGFVLIDSARCSGCSACIAACPHSARFLDPRTGTATKCTWCHDRVRQGLLPVCVGACPVQARKFGDLDDKNSEIWRILHDPRVIPVKPGEGRTALHYAGWRKEVV